MPAPSTDRRWAPRARRAASCSRASPPPRRPSSWRGTGCPGLCFQRSPHSCHLQRSVGKSSPHEVIHMEHHICRIFILTRFRASSGCRQSLCLPYGWLEWGSGPRRQRGSRGPGGQHAQGPAGARGPWGPRLHPGLQLALPWHFEEVTWQCPVSLAAPALSQLLNSCLFCAVSVRGQPKTRNHMRYFNREDLIQRIGETGVGGLEGNTG